jgi:AraC-like DNA-binding protein
LSGLAGALYAAGSGVALVAALQMAFIKPATKAYQAASAFLAVLAAVAALNAYYVITATHPTELLLLSLTLLGLLSPLLWLYVEDLSSHVVLDWRWRDLVHLVPAMLMVLLTAFFVYLYNSVRMGLSGIGQVAELMNAVAIGADGLALLILVQGSYLIIRILIRLRLLDRRLREVVSNTDRYQILWVRSVAGLLVMNGAITVADNLGVVSISEVAFAGFGLAFAVTVAVWAVRQVPCFQLDASKLERHAYPGENAARSASARYERSRLDNDRLEKIAARIDEVFRTDRIHLDPNLSLKKLSAATGVSDFNLSQTFSRKLSQTFFDYVNAWRIEDAKALLTNSNETILAVALEAGFNSKSSFYNAFKLVSGQTPSAFRAAQSSSVRPSKARP